MNKKNKSVDIGLQYMNELGFYAEKSRCTALKKLRSFSDKSSANNLVNILEDMFHDKGNYSSLDLFAAKNASLDLSLKLSSSFRADIYYKICNWIVNHKELFGSTILDLGCDCGIMTCFLARQFPKSHIIGIDIVPKAIENAKQLAVRLNVNNIEFICIDAFLFNKPVDTVFSMLIMHQLFDKSKVDYQDMTFDDIAKYWSLSFDKIIFHISKFLSDDGHIISIDSNWFFPFDYPLYLSFIYSLYHHNLCIKSFDFVSAKELGSSHNIQCLVSMYDNMLSTNDFDDILIFRKYVNNIVCKKYDLTKTEYFDSEAEFMRNIYCGELIRGFFCRLITEDFCEYSVWRDKLNPQSFVFFRTEKIKKLTRVNSKELTEVYKKIDSSYKNIRLGFSCFFEWVNMD